MPYSNTYLKRNRAGNIVSSDAICMLPYRDMWCFPGVVSDIACLVRILLIYNRFSVVLKKQVFRRAFTQSHKFDDR